jgi:hypothetical protein
MRLEAVGKRYGIRQPWVVRGVTADLPAGRLISRLKRCPTHSVGFNVMTLLCLTMCSSADCSRHGDR